MNDLKTYKFEDETYIPVNKRNLSWKVRNICRDANGEVFAYEGVVEYDQGYYSSVGNDNWVRLEKYMWVEVYATTSLGGSYEN